MEQAEAIAKEARNRKPDNQASKAGLKGADKRGQKQIFGNGFRSEIGMVSVAKAYPKPILKGHSDPPSPLRKPYHYLDYQVGRAAVEVGGLTGRLKTIAEAAGCHSGAAGIDLAALEASFHSNAPPDGAHIH